MKLSGANFEPLPKRHFRCTTKLAHIDERVRVFSRVYDIIHFKSDPLILGGTGTRYGTGTSTLNCTGVYTSTGKDLYLLVMY